VFNDPVHGHVFLPGLACDVMDTPQFQRLRDLKQLGLTYLVFPGASHNRFEHSLGTAHLASSVFMHLYRLQGLELGAEKRDGAAVTLAGLCHDLGHGPFSHVFDSEFLPRRLGASYASSGWSHEEMGAQMLDHLVDENYVDCTGEDNGPDLLARVKALITSGHGGPPPAAGKGWLQEIVANGRNSVDVDKFDYLARDCQNCGLKNSADFGRLQLYMKVLGDEICFKASEVLNVYELFHTRASLHQRVYTHRKAKAIEYMVVDALTQADAAWGGEISSAIWKAADFTRLDDTILKRIEWSAEPELAGAQALLRRLRRRELYRYVNEFSVPVGRLQGWKDVTPADVTGCQDGSLAGGLRPEDVIVHNLKVDYAMSRGRNPVDCVHFYQDYGSSDKFPIPKEKVSSLIPDVFQERKVRVFARSDDPAVAAAVEAAFLAYQRREYNCETLGIHRTPLKQGRKRAASDAPSLPSVSEGGSGRPSAQRRV